MDVNGIRGGKPDFVNTTLVAQADARFTIRLAPGQDPQTVADAAERLFREAVPADAQVELVSENSAPPGLFHPLKPLRRCRPRAVGPLVAVLPGCRRSRPGRYWVLWLRSPPLRSSHSSPIARCKHGPQLPGE